MEPAVMEQLHLAGLELSQEHTATTPSVITARTRIPWGSRWGIRQRLFMCIRGFMDTRGFTDGIPCWAIFPVLGFCPVVAYRRPLSFRIQQLFLVRR